LSICEQLGVTVVTHPYSKGNGAAIKTGAKTAKGEVIVFLDGDGQHKPEDIPQLLEKLATGYDMVVGARDKQSQADSFRAIANGVYNWLSSAITGHKILDLTSGFRAVKADKFKEFLYLLPNGFSYPTTSTMAFFRAGYSVGYMPIQTEHRLGESHISLLKDGIRFLVLATENIFADSCWFFRHGGSQLCLHLYNSGNLHKYECGTIDDGNHRVPYWPGVRTGYRADVQRQ